MLSLQLLAILLTTIVPTPGVMRGLAVPGAPPYQVTPCQNLLVKVGSFEGMIPLRQIHPNYLGPRDFSFLPPNLYRHFDGIGINTLEVFNPSDVLIAVEPPNHFALFPGYLRFDPRVMKAASVIRSNRSLPAGPGLIVRLQGLPQSTIDRLVYRTTQWRNSFSANCTYSICETLDESGIHIPDADENSLIPSQNLGRIFQYGFVDDDGSPIQMDFIWTSPKPPERFFKAMQIFDNRMESGVRDQIQADGWDSFVNVLGRQYRRPIPAGRLEPVRRSIEQPMVTPALSTLPASDAAQSPATAPPSAAAAP